jgi:KUP system potassium uptake protein
MPLINALLMVGCLAIVLTFRSSDALGNAYGLAVIGTMTVTSIVFYVVMRQVWHWGLALAVPVFIGFMAFDLTFLGANLAKLLEGAWVPLAIGLAVFLLLWAWTVGRARYGRALAEWAMPVEKFRRGVTSWTTRRDGTIVFLTFDLDHVPLVGRHDWLRENCQYQRILLLRIDSSNAAYVPSAQRVTVEDSGDSIFTAVAEFGFMESPRIGDVLPKALPFAWDEAVVILAQPISARHCSWLGGVVLSVYQFLRQTSLSPIERFHIPPGQAISVGLELEI